MDLRWPGRRWATNPVRLWRLLWMMTLFRDLSVTHIFLLPQFSLKKDWRHPPTDKTYAGILSGQSRVYLYTNTPYIKAHCVLFRCCHFANFTQLIDDRRGSQSLVSMEEIRHHYSKPQRHGDHDRDICFDRDTSHCCFNLLPFLLC